MTGRAVFAAALLAALTACASSSSMSEAEKDKAIAKCFKTFDNYPTQRNDCINRVRTSDTTPASDG